MMWRSDGHLSGQRVYATGFCSVAAHTRQQIRSQGAASASGTL